jgi:hypothetical protein
VAVLTILSLLAVASLRAQDRAPPTDGPRTTPGTPGTPAPTPPVPRVERAPEQVQAAELQLIAEAQAVILNRATQRFHFKIDPKTPLKELLPIPPASKNSASPVIAKDLTQVPEVQFQMPLDKKLPSPEGLKQTAHTIAKINHLNEKKTDGFLDALRHDRIDLTGLPFVMGDACRTKCERSKQFKIEVNLVRGGLREDTRQTGVGPGLSVVSQQFPPFGFTGSVDRVVGLQPAQPATAPTANSPQSAPTPPPATSSAATAPQPASTGGATVPAGASGPAVPAAPPQPPAVFVDNDGTIDLFSSQLATGEPVTPEKFWQQYQVACAEHDKNLSRADHCQQENVTLTRIAALMQVLAPESAGIRLGLVKYLASISHAEATRALAKLAIFSAEDTVRQKAIDALKVRRERDYTDILLAGLHYPWPDVARRASDAMVKLERTDLVPQLVGLLDEPDPRVPVVREESNKQVQEVRELVKINHHRSCLLCHAPANTGNVAGDTLTAAVPVPSDPLPSPSQGYQNSVPDILVRIDVTYLRQDFSMFQAVADANPWPEMQRFDFLVRTRAISDKEADAYREKLVSKEPGVLSPYHRAALAALRELTGRDTAPNAEAWRQLLKLPAKSERMALAR